MGKKIDTISRISNLLFNRLKELDMFDKNELDSFYEEIVEYVSQTVFDFMGLYLHDDEIDSILLDIFG